MNKHKTLLFLTIFSLAYLFLYSYRITLLPVFADEAIYIRWAQLIADDPLRYAFFPMNDGKTPLFFWLLAPFMKLSIDPLFAARMLSSIFGLGTALFAAAILKRISGSTVVAGFTAAIVGVLPFWFLHFRMALLDGPMTFFIAGCYYFALTIVTAKTYSTSKYVTNSVLLLGIFFGLSLLTKLTAILVLPSLLLFVFFPRHLSTAERVKNTLQIVVALGVGLGIFLLLRLHPAFPQLFSRGSDFLYSGSEIFRDSFITDSLGNLKNYGVYFLEYMTLPFIFLWILVFFVKQYRREVLLFTLQFCLTAFPIIILGKVVYPRYFLPSVLPLTLAGALGVSVGLLYILKKKHFTTSSLSLTLVAFLVLATSFGMSLRYIVASYTDPESVPYVSADQGQYLTEWSSGHGIKESAELLLSEKQNATLAVATEGFFGSLPDGILMYLYLKDVTGLRVEGIGQPVEKIPDSFITTAQNYEKVWLIANNHRIKMNLQDATLVKEYCRPFSAPCLQIWDITSLVKDTD